MKVVLVYDGSFKGLLTAIYKVFNNNYPQVTICKKADFTPDIFTTEIAVETDPGQALKVWSSLRIKAGDSGSSRIYKAFLSELKGAENCILEYIIAAYKSESFDSDNVELSCVKKINHAATMVVRSEERSLELVLRNLSGTNKSWVSLQPDFNVLPLLAKKILSRTNKHSWVIYDTKRNYGFRFHKQSIEPVYTCPVSNADDHGVEKVKGVLARS